MSQYEDDADRLADHNPETCDEPFCLLCHEEDEEEVRRKTLKRRMEERAAKQEEATHGNTK